MKFDAICKLFADFYRQLGECCFNAERFFEVGRPQRAQSSRLELQFGAKPVDGVRVVDADRIGQAFLAILREAFWGDYNKSILCGAPAISCT